MVAWPGRDHGTPSTISPGQSERTSERWLRGPSRHLFEESGSQLLRSLHIRVTWRRDFGEPGDRPRGEAIARLRAQAPRRGSLWRQCSRWSDGRATAGAASLTGGGESSEVAFAKLWSSGIGPDGDGAAANALLRDVHEAEDAFQAVFLIFAGKARSLRVADSLGPLAPRGGPPRRLLCPFGRGQAESAWLRGRRAGCSLSPAVPGNRWTISLRSSRWRNSAGCRRNTAAVAVVLSGGSDERAGGRSTWGGRRGRSGAVWREGRSRLHDRLTRRGLALTAGLLLTTLAAEGASAAVPARGWPRQRSRSRSVPGGSRGERQCSSSGNCRVNRGGDEDDVLEQVEDGRRRRARGRCSDGRASGSSWLGRSGDSRENRVVVAQAARLPAGRESRSKGKSSERSATPRTGPWLGRRLSPASMPRTVRISGSQPRDRTAISR